MFSAKYRIGNQVVSAEDPALQKILAEGYAAGGIRPVCLCRGAGTEMYVAKVGDQYIIKRMPGTGIKHDMSCVSYEHPAELSGLGEIMGTAIQENVEDGTTSLKFSFSLSKSSSGRAAPNTQGGSEKSTVKEDEKKLTLRSTLDYLWEEAGFHKWSPAMESKRNWYVIRKYLLDAARNKKAKGSPLGSLLYVPEVFSSEQREQLLLRRNAHLSQLTKTTNGARKMMIVVGEVKDFSPARYGFKMMIKHLPDFPFLMSEKLYARMLNVFADTLSLWDAVENAHLIVIGTFTIIPSGLALFEEIGLMLTTENWIPFEHASEKRLLEKLAKEGRSFAKGLRYNLPSYRPCASVVLLDTEPEPTAMYIVPNESEEYAEALQQLIEASELPAWVWDPAEQAIPTFPEKG